MSTDRTWPQQRRTHVRRAVWLAVALVGLASTVVVWRAVQSEGPDLSIVGVASSGDARFVGSMLEVPAHADAAFELAWVVTNRGDGPVQVFGLGAFPAVRAVGSGVRVGIDRDPVIEVTERLRLIGDPTRIDVPSFDDPSNIGLPVVLKPGEVALLLVAGRVMYCVDGESGSAVGLPMTLHVAVDGRYSGLVATEISLAFQDCG